MKLNFKLTGNIEDQTKGILYILIIRLEDNTEVVKIGVTKRKIEDRIQEILLSFYTAYRYFPYCYPKRFKTTTDVFGKESILHKEFALSSYTFDKKFGGYTEFFKDLDMDLVLKRYEEII